MSDLRPSDLVLLFKAAQKGLPVTDTTLIIGNYEFYVHSILLTSKSPFFAVALEGPFKEALTKKLHLTDEDPYVVARFIQFVYTSMYQLRQDGDEEFGRAHEGLSLQDIMQGFSKLEGFEANKAKDKNRSSLDVVIAMFVLADKCVVTGLVDVVIKNFVWIQQDFRSQPAQSLHTILAGVCSIQMARYPEFHEEVARFISFYPDLIQMPKLYERCCDDPQLTFLIAKECVREAETWKERTHAVERDLCRAIGGLTWNDFVTNWSRNPDGWRAN